MKPTNDTKWVIQAFFMSLISGCTIDYLSLWKTRYLLTRLVAFRGSVQSVGIIFLDAFATSALFSSAYLIAAVIEASWDFSFFSFEYFIHRYNLFFNLIKGDFLDFFFVNSGNLSPNGDSVLPVWGLYAVAMLTSAWLWVYLIAAYASRAINDMPQLIRVLSRFLDFDGHPAKAIGYVAAAASALIVGLLSII